MGWAPAQSPVCSPRPCATRHSCVCPAFSPPSSSPHLPSAWSTPTGRCCSSAPGNGSCPSMPGMCPAQGSAAPCFLQRPTCSHHSQLGRSHLRSWSDRVRTAAPANTCMLQGEEQICNPNLHSTKHLMQGPAPESHLGKLSPEEQNGFVSLKRGCSTRTLRGEAERAGLH